MPPFKVLQDWFVDMGSYSECVVEWEKQEIKWYARHDINVCACVWVPVFSERTHTLKRVVASSFPWILESRKEPLKNTDGRTMKSDWTNEIRISGGVSCLALLLLRASQVILTCCQGWRLRVEPEGHLGIEWCLCVQWESVLLCFVFCNIFFL